MGRTWRWKGKALVVRPLGSCPRCGPPSGWLRRSIRGIGGGLSVYRPEVREPDTGGSWGQRPQSPFKLTPGRCHNLNRPEIALQLYSDPTQCEFLSATGHRPPTRASSSLVFENAKRPPLPAGPFPPHNCAPVRVLNLPQTVSLLSPPASSTSYTKSTPHFLPPAPAFHPCDPPTASPSTMPCGA